ncbi:MAG: hypothetical protein DWH80_13465 [Planctomycetota bacterium]|nr:MAG: hypothetical protein DWH80_13465 [Planctomycetota bacterium]
MGHFLFFVFVVASCLLWSAACTAAAARTHRPWLRRLLEAVAWSAPVAALAPFVAFTAFLAFWKPMPTNWFGPTLATFLSALIGGIWIVWAGLTRANVKPLRAEADPVPLAARWPVVGLAAAFVMAKAVSFGTLLFIDNAVAAQGSYLRLEAAQLMQANLPPAVSDMQNAAPLYKQAFAALDADPALKSDESPLAKATTNDVANPAVTETLARHAATLDLIRRAADRDTCRFQRDWTRPSIDMLLPEMQSLRTAARLLVLDARREAADGNAADALHDVARIQRIGRHASNEPLLISNLVGLAIDTMALETLAQVLPTLRKSDLAALDSSDIRDIVTTPPAMASHYYGEEAFGLSTFAGMADSRFGVMNALEMFANQPQRPFLSRILPLTLLYRVFFLEADLTGYRSIMRRYQRLAAGSEPYPEVKKKTDAMETELRDRSPGMMSSLIMPALGGVFRAQAQDVARQRAASALVAAMKQRLETGTTPTTFEELSTKLVPPASRDPFTTDQPLVMKQTDDALLVYSIGPDGEDDGGPVAPGADKVEGNDDIGLRMAL